MLTSYLTGMAAIVVIMVVWVGIQGAWRRAFPETFSDPDVLAGRMGCHGCGCTDVCARTLTKRVGTDKEDTDE